MLMARGIRCCRALRGSTSPRPRENRTRFTPDSRGDFRMAVGYLFDPRSAQKDTNHTSGRCWRLGGGANVHRAAWSRERLPAPNDVAQRAAGRAAQRPRGRVRQPRPGPQAVPAGRIRVRSCCVKHTRSIARQEALCHMFPDRQCSPGPRAVPAGGGVDLAAGALGRGGAPCLRDPGHGGCFPPSSPNTRAAPARRAARPSRGPRSRPRRRVSGQDSEQDPHAQHDSEQDTTLERDSEQDPGKGAPSSGRRSGGAARLEPGVGWRSQTRRLAARERCSDQRHLVRERCSDQRHMVKRKVLWLARKVL